MSTILEQFKAARRVGTPLVAIQTPDPGALTTILRIGLNGKTAIVRWDICNGWQPVTESGAEAISEALAGVDPASATVNPVESAIAAQKLPGGTIILFHQAHRFLSDGPSAAAFVQALWNLRDPYKASNRTAVLLGPSFSFPPDLANDVQLLDEPLPSAEELAEMVGELAVSAELELKPAVKARAVDQLRGLAMFPAEQVTAMALSKQGLDLEALGARKRTMIEQTPGLSVWSGGETLAAVGGNDNIKRYLKLIVAGKDAPLCVVFIDEIEKALAGATGGDTSGVSQSQLQSLLTYMQDNNSSGMIFVGPPGAGKSVVAKAIGAEAGVPTIAMDLGGMKDSLVGSSEARVRNALKVISAVGAGRVLFVATCNKIGGLPPELRRRFTMGTFFFDLPDAEERKVIWDLYCKQFKLAAQPMPQDEGWTGAEIKQACVLAHRLGLPLKDTPQFIVPVAKAAAEELEALRRQAHNKFLSASKPGLYSQAAAVQVTAKRALQEVKA